MKIKNIIALTIAVILFTTIASAASVTLHTIGPTVQVKIRDSGIHSARVDLIKISTGNIVSEKKWANTAWVGGDTGELKFYFKGGKDFTSPGYYAVNVHYTTDYARIEWWNFHKTRIFHYNGFKVDLSRRGYYCTHYTGPRSFSTQDYYDTEVSIIPNQYIIKDGQNINVQIRGEDFISAEAALIRISDGDQVAEKSWRGNPKYQINFQFNKGKDIKKPGYYKIKVEYQYHDPQEDAQHIHDYYQYDRPASLAANDNHEKTMEEILYYNEKPVLSFDNDDTNTYTGIEKEYSLNLKDYIDGTKIINSNGRNTREFPEDNKYTLLCDKDYEGAFKPTIKKVITTNLKGGEKNLKVKINTTYRVKGNYILACKVKDIAEESNLATKHITVKQPQPTTSIKMISKEVKKGKWVSFKAEGKAPLGALITSYKWTTPGETEWHTHLHNTIIKAYKSIYIGKNLKKGEYYPISFTIRDNKGKKTTKTINLYIP